MSNKYRYTSVFESVAKVAAITDTDRFVAKASLAPLKGILPPDVNPENDPDLLYISSDGAVGGLINKNGDGITAKKAIEIHATAKHKYISTDHDKGKVVGVVLFPALTTLGDHRILTDEEAATLQEPFNMSFAGVLWKAVQPLLAKYITKTGDSLDTDALSMSWEIAFNEYSIGVGSKNLWDAKVYTESDAEFRNFEKRLRCNGGNGKTAEGEEVFRIIDGDAIILGYSIVQNPAASVKGILPVTEVVKADEDESKCCPDCKCENCECKDKNHEEEMEDDEDEEDDETEEESEALTPAETPAVTSESPAQIAPENSQESNASVTKVEEKIITEAKTCVTLNTATMKIESLDQLKSLWPELRKMESVAAVEDFVNAIQKGTSDWEQKLADEKNIVQNLEKAKADAEARANELQTSLDNVKKEVDDLKSAQAAAEATQKFQERMASFDEEFDLDDEDRQMLASDLKSLPDDEAFAAYQKKMGKLMCGKKKGKAMLLSLIHI